MTAVLSSMDGNLCHLTVGDDKPQRKGPLAIAHRGFSASYPENTMSAFVAAVEAGVQALETDVHLSNDEVVVLSHDPSLRRCFGEKGKIIDHDWAYLSNLKTLKKPHDRMPRLVDLLSYLASPGLEHIWLLLDIKVDNDRNNIMRLIARTIDEIPPGSKPWVERITLGCWAMEYLPLCDKYLPGFPIAYIGFDIFYARRFLQVPNVSFNILQKVLIGPAGDRFLRDARAADRAVFVWTVNEVRMMRWSIRKEVDGVITDDPGKFIEVRDEYDGQYTEDDQLTFKAYLSIVGINILAACFGMFFRWRWGFRIGSMVGRNVVQYRDLLPGTKKQA